MEQFFMEKYNLKTALVPVDLNDGANTGLRISLKDATRVAFIVLMADSTAGVTNFSLKQHDAATAGNSKALSVDNPYYRKINSESVFTKVTPGAATDNFVPTAFANDPGIVVFEVLAEQLDRDNGYGWVSLDMADATAAKLGGILAVVESKSKPAYGVSI